MVQHLWAGCCPDGSSLPVTLPFVASTSRAAWGVAVSHFNLFNPLLVFSWQPDKKPQCWAKFVFACSWCSTRLVPAQSWDDLHTKSGVGVPWKYESVFPIGSGWTGLHAIRSSTHAFPWGKKTSKKNILKGSTSFEAATRRPFKSFQLKIYSTYNNTAKCHALSGAVIDAISWTCYPIYCVHGAEKSKSTPAPGLGT